MGIGLFGCDALLELINTPEEILADSALYLDCLLYTSFDLLLRNACGRF